MVSASIIPLLSSIISIFAILISLSIFKRVYQEDYKKPWLYIGISAIFAAISHIIKFLSGFYHIYIINLATSETVSFILDFLVITVMTYGLILEYLILKYFKGKFVKMKLIPVQEGSLAGEIDLDVSKGNSYFLFKKDKNFIFEQFSDATRKGFEGFLLSEDNPKSIRTRYKLEKTPLVWFSQINTDIDSRYLEESLDQNAELVDPLQLNKLISYIDNFLEQSVSPFLIIELNLILRINNPNIVFEFLKYISNKVNNYNGVLLCMLNEDVLTKTQENELRGFLRDLD